MLSWVLGWLYSLVVSLYTAFALWYKAFYPKLTGMAEPSEEAPMEEEVPAEKNKPSIQSRLKGHDSYFLNNDYSRPWPAKEDVVVYKKKSGMGVAHIHKLKKGNMKHSRLYPKEVFCGHVASVESTLNSKVVTKSVEELLVVDRPFTAGETVVAFKNQYPPGDPKERELWCRDDAMIGMVIEVKTFCDVLTVPDRRFVLRDVAIDKEPEYAELVGFNLAHNYVMYEHWIGDAKDCVNDITCTLKHNKFTTRVVIREAGDRSRGIVLCRSPADESKSIVPNDVFMVPVASLQSPKFVTWLGPCPTFLRRKGRRSVNRFVRLVVEKVEPYELDVDWLMSPSDPLNMPPKWIPHEELPKVQRIDLVPHPRVSPMDRIVIRPKDTDVMVTKNEYLKELAQKYGNSFRSWKSEFAKGDDDSSSSSSDEETDDKSSEPSMKMPRIDEEAEDEMMEDGEENNEEEEDNEEEEGAKEEADNDDSEEEEKSVTNIRRRRHKGCLSRRHRFPRAALPAARGAKELFGDSFYGEVVMTKTLVTVRWMDGSVEDDIPGCQLMMKDPDLDQQDHIPGTLVSRKGEPPTDLKFGMILRTNTTDRSCKVRWFKRADVRSPIEFDKDEEVTLFEIMPNAEYKRTYVGYFGVNLERFDSELRNIAYQVISDLNNGKQLVRYFDGTTQELWPDEITALNFEEDSQQEDDEESVTEGELEEIGPDQYDEFGELLPAGATMHSIRLKTADTPQDVCDRMHELLKKATAESMFQALGLSSAACPSNREIAGNHNRSNAGLIPDRNGRYLDVKDKVLWDIKHKNVEEATEYLKAKHVLGLSLGDSGWNLTEEQCKEFPEEHNKMKEQKERKREARLSFPFLEKEVLHTLVRMGKIACYSLEYLDTYTTDGVILVAGFLSASEAMRLVLLFFRAGGFFIGESLCVGDDKFILLQVRPEDENRMCEFFHAKLDYAGNKMMVMTLQEAMHYFALSEFLKTTVVNGKYIRSNGSEWNDEGEETAKVLTEKVESIPNSAPPTPTGTEKIAAIQVIGDFIVEEDAVDMFSIMGQAIRCTTYPHITIDAKADTLGVEESLEFFLDDFMKLSRLGIISGPYFDYAEVFSKFIELFVRKTPFPVTEAGMIDKYLDQLASLRNLLQGNNIGYWKRMNHILACGFLPDYFHESFMDKSNDGPRKIPMSKLIRLMNETKNAELKVELDIWRRMLKVEEETKKEDKEAVPRFEVLNDHPSTHNFASREISANRKFFQAVIKEHKFLDQHLPEGIFVRAYSDRMHLMNAVIVGPAGTPFEGIPFIFDICLPENYPKSAPEVHYVAYSQEQLNPNLYQTGKVCTSLLGTWSGEGSENWSSSSNIQQVLISIQSLILVPEPYFNEAGYEARRALSEAKAHSERYNETVTINALDYLFNVFMKPPQCLEDIVLSEVVKNWPTVKGLCESWSGDGLPSFPICASKGFRMAVKNAAEKMDVVVEKFNNDGGLKLKKEAKTTETSTHTVPQHDDSYLLLSNDFDLSA